MENVAYIPTQSTAKKKEQGQKFKKNDQCYSLPMFFQARYDLAWEYDLGWNAWQKLLNQCISSSSNSSTLRFQIFLWNYYIVCLQLSLHVPLFAFVSIMKYRMQVLGLYSIWSPIKPHITLRFTNTKIWKQINKTHITYCGTLDHGISPGHRLGWLTASKQFSGGHACMIPLLWLQTRPRAIGMGTQTKLGYEESFRTFKTDAGKEKSFSSDSRVVWIWASELLGTAAPDSGRSWSDSQHTESREGRQREPGWASHP